MAEGDRAERVVQAGRAAEGGGCRSLLGLVFHRVWPGSLAAMDGLGNLDGLGGNLALGVLVQPVLHHARPPDLGVSRGDQAAAVALNQAAQAGLGVGAFPGPGGCLVGWFPVCHQAVPAECQGVLAVPPLVFPRVFAGVW